MAAPTGTQPRTAPLAPGTEAPDFELGTPQGDAVRLSDQRGKSVLLEFFATWCGLCNTEAPHVKKIAAALDPRKFSVITINADGEDAASVYAFHRFHKLPFVALLDPSARPGSFNRPGLPGPVSQGYGMKSLPTFYVIGPDGTITWRSDGEQPDA
jgi:peroxiredoxin